MMSLAAAAQAIPADPAFRVGRLDNGMTYYICHNELPAGCADFYIAHNVGALQEEDNQNGLAHFLEHMAFNGTRHYPAKGLLEFLARDGVRFGYNVNAYTSRTETVYNISSVPLVRDSFIDSVLLVLHDWSCDISCEQKALDDERGVISEEWRLRDSDTRYAMMQQQNALIYKGSKQTERSVLGTLEIINGFRRDEILDFYHKWYRPDLQAIIVVGDFDVDEMESRVRAKFRDIPARVDPEPKVRYLPPKLTEPLTEDMTDGRIKYNALKIIYKQPYPDWDARATEDCIRDALCRQVVSAVLGERLRRLSQQKASPARSAVVVTSGYEPDFYVTLFTVTPKGKERIAECLEFTHREIRRLLEFGISAGELEAARLYVSQRMRLDREMSRDEVKSEELVKVALEHFLRNHPLVGPVESRDIRRRLLSEISLESIKNYPAKVFSESEVIYSTCYNNVEEPGIAPSPDEVRSIIARVDSEILEPFFAEQPKLDLSVDAVPGSIVKKRLDRRLGGFEEWTLSNGARVYYRHVAPTKSSDHLVVSWHFDTGYRSYPAGRVDAFRQAAAHNNRTLGFRGLDRVELRNCPELAGVSIITHTLQQYASIDLAASRGKEETAFKAGYLMLSEPFFGKESRLERAKEDYLKRLSRKKGPRTLFEEKYERQVYGNHPWLQPVDSAAIEAVDMDLLKEAQAREFGDFGHMKLFVTSDLDRSDIEALVCRYAASLHGDYPYKKTGTPLPKPVLKGFNMISETNPPESEPVSSVDYTFVSGIRSSSRNLLVSAFLDYIVSARYIALIREERGGTYHVGYSTDVPDNPALPWKGIVAFQTRPEMTDMLLDDVAGVMADMAKNGPTDEEMALARKYLRKRHGEVERRVSMSLPSQHDRLIYTVLWGRDYDFDYDAVLDGIRASDVRCLARKMRSGANIVKVYTEK